MPAHYHLFYGAPSAKQLPPAQRSGSFSWTTVVVPPCHTAVAGIPPSTLAAASRRISELYENVIFGQVDEEQDEPDKSESLHDHDVPREEQTTLITWASTTQGREDNSTRPVIDISFLRPSASLSRVRSEFLTQDTQGTGSYDYSDASSITHFPVFHFSLHLITPLASLSTLAEETRVRHARKGSRKINLLAAVLEIEGPDAIRLKKGPDAGKEVSLLKLVLGDETGGLCKLSAWREVAEDWAGLSPHKSSQPVQKGDIIFLENVLAVWEAGVHSSVGAVPISCSASPQLRPRLEVCYRGLPSDPQDARLRPDLRLGLSDAVVRKVAATVKWFEEMAGLV